MEPKSATLPRRHVFIWRRGGVYFVSSMDSKKFYVSAAGKCVSFSDRREAENYAVELGK